MTAGLTTERLRGAVPECGPSSARALAGHAEALEALASGARSAAALAGGWQGRPAGEAAAAGLLLGRALAEAAGTARAAAAVARAAGAAVSRAQELLARADRTAATQGLRVLGDGRVPWSPVAVHGALDVAEARAQEVRRAQVSRAAELAAALARAALEAALEADRDAARALSEVGRPVTLHVLLGRGRLLAEVTARPLPLPGAVPLVVAGWWASQPASARVAAARSTPAGLAALDGLPVRVRDRAHRQVLRTALAGTLDPHVRSALLQVRRQLGAHPGSRLLALDVDRGLAAVVLGDADRARNVAVLVPGMFGDTAHGLPGLLDSAAALRARAGPGVAVVAWTGYAAPRGPSVAWQRRARDGAPRLRSALRGLDALAGAAGRDPLLTGLGHSYGSLVLGLTAREDTGVDALVLLGSPGSGADAATELRVPPGRVFVAEAPWDPVADLGRFGRDPGDAAFGARLLDVEGIGGHSEYYAQGSGALACLAQVVSGDDDCAAP